MTSRKEVLFLFDVDNTLLDNDCVQVDLRKHLEREFGAESRDRYWAIFEEMRTELGYSDYLGALQRYRVEDLCDPRLLTMSSFLVDYPFANPLYPRSLDALEHFATGDQRSSLPMAMWSSSRAKFNGPAYGKRSRAVY
jgi:FMN phosphatase YigB (HAD superfamily)